jgi:hypothetical protein
MENRPAPHAHPAGHNLISSLPNNRLVTDVGYL